jgi:DNA (cytosine-5)-methyltransferase 1
VGYSQAGFEVVGVDIRPQPRYPFRFIQGDALDYIRRHGREFDAVHASPPCQAFTAMAAVYRKRWGHGPTAPDLIDPVRRLLVTTARPWAVENVVGSPLRRATLLCGSMFGLGVRRHRLFECSHLLLAPPCRHRGHDHRGVYGDHPGDRRLWTRKGGNGPMLRSCSLEDARRRMGIDWMLWGELTQAIPPAYTEFVGRQLRAVLEARAV